MRFHQGLKSEHHSKAEKEKHLNHQTIQFHNFGFQALVFRGSIFRGFAMNLPNLGGGLTPNITLKGGFKKVVSSTCCAVYAGGTWTYNNLEPDSHPLIKWNRLSIGWWWCQIFAWAMEMVFNPTSIHLKTGGFFQGELWEIHRRESRWWNSLGQVKNRMGRMPWIFGSDRWQPGNWGYTPPKINMEPLKMMGFQ